MCLAFIASNLAGGARAEGFKLLEIDHATVRWFGSQSGELVLSYAFAGDVDEGQLMETPTCGRLRPFRRLLGAAQLSQSDLTAAVERAFARWQRVANVTFIRAKPGDAAQIMFGVQGEPSGVAFTGLNLGEDRDGTRGIVNAAICINPEHEWKVGFDGILSSYELEYVFTHEIGHVLGLDHPGARGHVMGFKYLEASSALSEGDIAGAVQLYGARATPPKHLMRFARRVGLGAAK